MSGATVVVHSTQQPEIVERPCGRTSLLCVACGNTDVYGYLDAPDRFFARAKPYHLVRCASCDLVWLSDPPLKAEMDLHYGTAYDAFIRKATEKRAEEHWAPAVTTVAKYKSGGTLLDLGCGSGSFLKSMRGSSWQLTGVEMSEGAAQLAYERTGANVWVGDILNAPFVAGAFDVVTCLHVLEHAYEPHKVFEKVWGWLKPGGLLYVQVPNIQAAEARLFRSYWYPLELPRHLFHFSPRSLDRLAASCSYRTLEINTASVSFLEYSGRYIGDDLFARLGIRRLPLATAPTPSLPWRLFRKALRLSIFPLAAAGISLRGSGQIIEAAFSKPA